jgi:DNA gyrase subunit A
MNDIAKETISANLEEEMRRSYLDYAMSVIVGRALPDVRDGLKPVHRRILFAMAQLGCDWNKPHKKSARIVGEVIGKYHPHGESAIYDAIVRMAQDFSLRYPLVDGQGNFGSVDGDAPAAMRYTEVRLARISHDLLEDLDKETVDFGPNYDETAEQPLVLPTRVPNLLVNGSSGIAVGMATNIPPHNLNEVINGCLALIEDQELPLTELMKHIPGPDFPTEGIIYGDRGIYDAYTTGKGRIFIRARVSVEQSEKADRATLIVTELPYQVNKARLLEKIAELVKNKRIDGITGLRDESDKNGMRMVIQLRRGEVPDIVLNNLFKHTQLQTVFGINLIALAENQPRLFNLRDLLLEFIRHRREVVTRRTIHDLRKARSRAHILEGLAVALANIDEIIILIKAAENPLMAREQLQSKAWQAGVVSGMLERAGSEFSTPEDIETGVGLSQHGYMLSGFQAQAILDLRLHRLTGLEQDKIRKEYGEILDRIQYLLGILESQDRLMGVVREELLEIQVRYGDNRQTEINSSAFDLTDEDLITPTDMVVTLSYSGYAKAQPVADYQAQRRGGKGRIATKNKDEDFVRTMFIANSHDTILCFSNAGKVYWLKVYQLPQAGRYSRGRPLVNLLPLDDGERATAFLRLAEYPAGHFVFMATRNGTVKKCAISSFSRPRSTGLRAIELVGDDELVAVELTSGTSEVLLFGSTGKALRFHEKEVREMGRTARGVRGIALKSGQGVISMIAVAEGESGYVLAATSKGYGKRTQLKDFPSKRRGGQGVIAIRDGARNGTAIGAELVSDEGEIILITDGGRLVRTRVSEVSIQTRNTQGVRLVALEGEEVLVSLRCVHDSNGEERPPGTTLAAK